MKTPKIAPLPSNPDWVELLLDGDFNISASLQVDRWNDYVQREFEGVAA